uniref:Uncharacterized protein n=1 Tax=Anguilla anguilla TaxID=7936 RepID=A0A0E9TG57_ANGAN
MHKVFSFRPLNMCTVHLQMCFSYFSVLDKGWKR